MALQNFTAVSGQSIYDVCINCYGTLDLIYKLLRDNNISNLDALPTATEVYVYDDSLIVNQALQQDNMTNGVKYATI